MLPSNSLLAPELGKKFNDFNLVDWLGYLENRDSQEIQLRLLNAQLVAKKLNLLQFDIPVITVAGTNGKGSTVATLDAIYSAAGYRVGVYTSPHLFRFNERICINQQPITDHDLCCLLSQIEHVRADIDLTYFETITLAALLYFKQRALDLIILEVGMGGRLDATNIIDADLAIITTIDFDHQAFLGTTKEAIGYEKAGIIRRYKPVIYADEEPPQSIRQVALDLNASLYCLEHDYRFNVDQNSLNLTIGAKTIHLPRPQINVKAAVAGVFATSCLANFLNVNERHCFDAMRTVHIRGRQQVVAAEVTTIYDVAHNPQAVALLAEFIQQHWKGRIYAVFTALNDKDLQGLIKPMQKLVTDWFPVILNCKRGAQESLLERAFQAENIHISDYFHHPKLAYEMAKQQAKPGDVIVVYGSFRLLEHFEEEIRCNEICNR